MEAETVCITTSRRLANLYKVGEFGKKEVLAISTIFPRAEANAWGPGGGAPPRRLFVGKFCSLVGNFVT